MTVLEHTYSFKMMTDLTQLSMDTIVEFRNNNGIGKNKYMKNLPEDVQRALEVVVTYMLALDATTLKRF